MAWVRMVDERDARGAVAQIYWGGGPATDVAAGAVEVPEIIKVFSLLPGLLAARVAFGNAMTFGGSGLGRFREELIATSVSALLACRF